MKRYIQSSVSALGMSALVLGGVVATASIIAAPAFSKNNNSNNENRSENGNRGGNENSNRGGNENSNGNNGRGFAASSLGALNAASANANALANASMNSQVGMIALYKAAVEASAEATQQIEDAQAAYDAYLLAQFDAGFISEYGTYDEYLTADPAPTEEEILYWETVNSLQLAIDTAIDEADTAKIIEATSLEMAANKETDDQVIETLWGLLDL